MLLALALAPLLVTLDSWDGWKSMAAERGWQWVAYEKNACNDGALKEIETLIGQRSGVDRTRLYLAGRGETSACVFYNASRTLDLWAAALAIEGDAREAIETNRLFASNLSMTPILWVAHPDPARRTLPGVTIREQATAAEAAEFLAARQRDPWPPKIDFETGSPKFLRCAWLGITKVDVTRRNDALPGSRVPPGSGARLEPGPIKPGDRILAIAGKDPTQFLDEVRQERSVAVTVQRGKEKLRLETRVVIPVREEALTVRVQAEVQPETKEIVVITRGIVQLKLNLPPQWAPAVVNWNGPSEAKLEMPGCHLLTSSTGAVSVEPCR
jgi:hypothetical protein